jgi:hypothetical protein
MQEGTLILMRFAGYVSVCVQLYCVGFHCLALHISAYMAIFRSVGYFIFICLNDYASLLFFFFLFYCLILQAKPIEQYNAAGC